MFIVLSPTKTFTNAQEKTSFKPYFSEKAQKLITKLKMMSTQEIATNFKVSSKIALQVSNYYQKFHNDFAAIYQYGGTTYKYLKAETLSTQKLQNIYILSGLYGILNAFDGISPYRLEMTYKALGSLYEYWQSDVTNYLINKTKNNLIINLASEEYAKIINFQNLNLITINFYEIKNEQLSSTSMMRKKMRGMMANYLLANNITTVEAIKTIVLNQFKYDDKYSKSNYLIFTRRE